ncbi:MAG TPA: alpha/beta hydrolase [Polyangia bacterium]|jgi:pimeloyl-ACP methyl ester carboxylesterase
MAAMPPREATMSNLSPREQQEIDRANDSPRQPVVFVHGLWLLPNSWDPWRRLFEENGFATLAPGWPDDPETVEEAHRHPEVFAKKTIKQITDHHVDVIAKLKTPPAIVGHSFGGLITQMLAGQGLASVSVAISPAPFRGVLPLPLSSLKAAFPVIGNPANYGRAVPLTLEQFRFAFANAVDETEAGELYQHFSVPGSAVPLFQAAAANLNPWTEDHVDYHNPSRGPLLIIAGEKDNTAPPAIADASFKKQQKNQAPTEIKEIPGRGHSLIIDSGWRAVADVALAFVKQHG